MKVVRLVVALALSGFVVGLVIGQTLPPISTQQINYVYYPGAPLPSNYSTVQSALTAACAANVGYGLVDIEQGASPADAPTIGGQSTYTITGCTHTTIKDERGTTGATCYAYASGTNYSSTSCDTGSSFNLPAALAASPYNIVNSTCNFGLIYEVSDGVINCDPTISRPAPGVLVLGDSGANGDITIYNSSGRETASITNGAVNFRYGGEVPGVNINPSEGYAFDAANKNIGNLANGTLATDAATFGQLGTDQINSVTSPLNFSGGVLGCTGCASVSLSAMNSASSQGILQNTTLGYFGIPIGATGRSNSGFGAYALDALTTGQFNAAFGNGALGSTQADSANSAFGVNSLAALNGGSANSAFGDIAGLVLTTGGSNALFGRGAGSTITAGSNNSLFGTNSAVQAATDSNEIVVGYGVTGKGSNTTTLGNSSTTEAYIYGGIVSSSLAASTSPVCPNGTGGALTTTGCASSGAVTSLTTTGTSGVATLSGGILNIPNYTITANAINNAVTSALSTSIGVNNTLGSGNNNTVFGNDVAHLTTGSYNILLGNGENAFPGITTGSSNIAIGNYAMGSSTGSSNVIAIGNTACAQTGSSNICLGNTSSPQTVSDTNEIVVGSSTAGNGSNTVTIGAGSGATAITDTYLVGNLHVSSLSPSTSPICPNGTGGGLTTTGCSGGQTSYVIYPFAVNTNFILNQCIGFRTAYTAPTSSVLFGSIFDSTSTETNTSNFLVTVSNSYGTLIYNVCSVGTAGVTYSSTMGINIRVIN